MARRYSHNHEMILELEDLKIHGDLDGVTAKKEDNLHRLFYYPAMMVPVTQSQIINVVSKYLPHGAYAFDPFMGSGTSLLSCMEFGLNVYGQDINPLSVLLVEAKTSIFDSNIISETKEFIESEIVSDTSDSVDVSFSGIDKWFSKEAQIALSKIRRAILKVSDKRIRSFLWIIMAEVIRVDSNDRTSTFKLHKRPDDEINSRHVNILSDFVSLMNRGVSDINSFRNKLEDRGSLHMGNYVSTIDVKWGNSMLKIENNHSFDVLVSSPPYGDNRTTVTYGQHSYLPLQWIPKEELPENIDYNYLKTTQEIDSVSLGGRLNKQKIETILPGLLNRIPALDKFFETIKPENKSKFYKTFSFIADFEESLNIIVNSMNEDAIYIWTIGNRNVDKTEIPNDEILIDLMNQHGIPLVFDAERAILNKKQAKRNKSSKTMEKERILIFQRQIAL